MTSLRIEANPLEDMVAALASHYPLLDGDLPVKLVAGAPEGVFEISREEHGATLRYGGTAQACRGVGTLLAGMGNCREETPFKTLGAMLDCSRNAVMTVEHFKGWLRQLALLGYNMAMLYTEDTYDLPGEEYFGYLRGKYSAVELREIDNYAGRLGIEMIGCIQSLGHLERILRWPEYRAVKDTDSVLMVDEEGTYELIEKMVGRFAECYRSRRIHIGMDETHDLGRGRFMDLRGYERGRDIFSRHLGRVVAICENHGLRPMLWSDMYFRMGSPTQAYDTTCEVGEDAKRQIPHRAQLVYWDYYHADRAYYEAMIRKHRELSVEPLMASGVWTWSYLWYQREKTEANVPPCVSACREMGVREIFFTMWGDDGAYCEFDSALAGLTFAAEQAYGASDASDANGRASERFKAVCGADYDAVVAAAELNAWPNPVLLLWDDPLLRIAWKNENTKKPGVWQSAAQRYARITRRLKPHREQTRPVDIAHACTLLEFLRKKIQLNERIDAGDFQKIKVQPVIRALERLHASFRRQWQARNKVQGFETIQVRLGGQRQRYLELATRLEELASGKIESIPELADHPGKAAAWTPGYWRELAVAGGL